MSLQDFCTGGFWGILVAFGNTGFIDSSRHLHLFPLLEKGTHTGAGRPSRGAPAGLHVCLSQSLHLSGKRGRLFGPKLQTNRNFLVIYRL